MATWDDAVRDPYNMIAGALIHAGRAVDLVIKTAPEDEDISYLVDTRDWLRDRANLFSPPGEPSEGYPEAKGGATVISLDAFREWKRIEKRQA